LPYAKPVLLKTLDKDAETGLIVESISREKMVAFRSSTFLELMDMLVHLLGEGRLSETLIGQMGSSTGRSMFAHLESEVKSTTDLAHMMDIVMAERGWGRCRELKKVEFRGLTYRTRVEGNPISGKDGANEPMCNFVRGFTSGFLEAFLLKKAKHSEHVACRATGAPYCIFEVTFD
jgi:predicted hydrocarbon binding protein